MKAMVACILALFVAGQAVAATGVIAGQVLEQGTNQPIADARVMIMAVSGLQTAVRRAR